MATIAGNRRLISAATQVVHNGNPSADGSPVTIANTSTHDGAPSLIRLPNDDLMILYRQATDHGATFDGVWRKRTSTDDGATWSSATTIWDPTPDSAGSVCVARLTNDDLLITGWKKLNGVSDWEPIAMISTDDGATWGSPISIGTSFTGFALPDCRAVERANGDLYVPMYGKNTGDGFESIRLSKSTNGGASWSDAGLIADGVTASKDWQEPCLIELANGAFLCMVRSDTGTPGIYRTRSYDQGATWEPLVLAWAGSGRPSVFQRGDGAITVMYRRNDNDDFRFRTSWDGGSSWTSSDGDFTGGNGLYMMYGSWWTFANGQLICAYALQTTSVGAGTDPDSDCYFAKIAGYP